MIYSACMYSNKKIFLTSNFYSQQTDNQNADNREYIVFGKKTKFNTYMQGREKVGKIMVHDSMTSSYRFPRDR